MTNPNTDVPASIAGYFYQFLLAVKELGCLVRNGHDNDRVAIEKGADVRIFRQDNNKKSVEAKFYNDTHFTANHSSICHTLYNFYTSFLIAKKRGEVIDQYEYQTNVPIREEDKVFFDEWKTPQIWDDLKTKEYVKYIKMSIVRDRLSSERGKLAMNDYKKIVYDVELDKVFKEFNDKTSDLVPFLEKSIDGRGFLSVLEREDRKAKLDKLDDMIKKMAYTEQRSAERRKVKSLIENLKKRTKKPGIDELFESILKKEVNFDEFTPTIFIRDDIEITIDLTTDELFEEFAQNIQFSFGNEYLEKVSFIKELKEDVISNLMSYDTSLKKEDGEKIIHAIIDKIFATTIEEDSQGISVNEVKTLIYNHHEINHTLLKSYLAEKLANEVESRIQQLFSFKLNVIENENTEIMKKTITDLFIRYLDAALSYEIIGMEKFGYISLEEFNRLFKVNKNGISGEELADILLCLTILSHFSDDSLKIEFKEKGINNVHLNSNLPYVLKNVDAFGEPNYAIIQFVHYVLRNISSKNVRPKGFEKIVLFTNVDESDYESWNMESILNNYSENEYVQDIAQVIDVDDNRKMIESFEFKWDSMILPKSKLDNSIDFKERVNKFIRG